MKIYVKTNEGRTIRIPAPLWLVRCALSMGTFGIRLAKNYAPEESQQYLDMVDLKELKKGFSILKDYKGLKLVDVKASDGTIVEIIV